MRSRLPSLVILCWKPSNRSFLPVSVSDVGPGKYILLHLFCLVSKMLVNFFPEQVYRFVNLFARNRLIVLNIYDIHIYDKLFNKFIYLWIATFDIFWPDIVATYVQWVYLQNINNLYTFSWFGPGFIKNLVSSSFNSMHVNQHHSKSL